MSSPSHRPRRPVRLAPQHLAKIAEGPADSTRPEAAHRTAQAVLARGRDHRDEPAEVARLVRLVETEGIDEVAALWSDSPPDTLPGALWRLYLLREWIRRDARQTADWFAVGTRAEEVGTVVAGVAEPPGPTEVAELADAVLAGAVTADLDVALDRAAAFCAVVATGSLAAAGATDSEELVARSGQLRRTAADLMRAARLARADELT